MKKIISLAFFFLHVSFVFCQGPEKEKRVDDEFPTPIAFPYEYTGEYFGNLNISDNLDTLSNIPTEFSLFESDEKKDEFIYQLTFISGGKKEIKKYKLKIIDEEKGFYVIEDSNGLEFMAVLIKDTLYSTFELDGKITFSTLRFTNTRQVYLKIVLSKKVKNKSKNNLINSNVILVQQAKFTR
ncbi:hypothetical protein [Pseudofulvibacter geojedonensis]|uniref:Lipoprotein n=1 Tax=Pseudofulvibacter geojedonensis TaxID=1123758 RepID=A0ABW3HZV5_9FLAO